MTTEGVLRKSWELFQKHWQFLALVALIGFGVSIVLAVIMAGSVAGGLAGLMAGSANGNLSTFGVLTSGFSLASLGVGAIVSLLVLPWMTGATAHAGKLTVEGRTGSPWLPYQAALRQYVTFLLLAIVLGIALGVGFALLIIPGVILAVLLGLAPTVVAVENASVGTALKTSWALGLKHFWTILLVGVVVAAVSFVLALVLGWVPLVGSYASTLVAVFGAVAMTVLYTEAK